jgi:hypothetical protein
VFIGLIVALVGVLAWFTDPGALPAVAAPPNMLDFDWSPPGTLEIVLIAVGVAVAVAVMTALFFRRRARKARFAIPNSDGITAKTATMWKSLLAIGHATASQVRAAIHINKPSAAGAT